MAAASAVKPAIEGVVLRNTGTYGSPTWTEIELVRDVNPAMPWDMGDASSRATRAKLYNKTQIDIPYSIVVRADDADTGYVALFDASVSPTTVIDMMILDGPISTEGAMGIRCHFLVNFASQTGGAADNCYTTFDLKPGYSSAGVPKSVKMGASSVPSFTAF